MVRGIKTELLKREHEQEIAEAISGVEVVDQRGQVQHNFEECFCPSWYEREFDFVSMDYVCLCNPKKLKASDCF
tara:strand:+ start:180 stop:401 length:222 start_codon:yes stop_codon:yes gene_type:complete